MKKADDNIFIEDGNEEEDGYSSLDGLADDGDEEVGKFTAEDDSEGGEDYE